jgi:ribosomal silencing factor RsfS
MYHILTDINQMIFKRQESFLYPGDNTYQIMAAITHLPDEQAGVIKHTNLIGIRVEEESAIWIFLALGNVWVHVVGL